MKNSIKVVIALIIAGLNITGLHAQSATVSGVFMTEQDYRINKMTYPLAATDKLQLNEFLNGKNIRITYQGKKITLAKNQIFGYRLNNQDFRFYDNEAYKIVDTAGFMLYNREKLAPKAKGYAPAETWFYSVNAGKPVLSLNMENLWVSFKNQPAFRYALQNNLGRTDNLAAYDSALKQYQIKYLYFQQKQAIASN